jgi:hypothetical protein
MEAVETGRDTGSASAVPLNVPARNLKSAQLRAAARSGVHRTERCGRASI